jgi:tetratricopeptide (TPR) repeat protein
MYGNKARAPQLTAFLAAVKSGAPHEQAFRDAFGDVNALDRELNEYIRLFTFPALQLNFGEKVGGAGGQRGVVIPDPLAAAYLGDLLARLERTDEARATLSNVLQKSPDVARAACVLGLIHLRAGQYDEAMPLLERAATLAPDDPWVQTALGRALVALFEEPRAPDDASALLPRAREVLTRAIERDPDSAYTRVLLGRAHLLPGGDLERATSSLERAVQLTPGREDYRLLLAQAFIRQGQTARATDLLGPLLASGSRPEIRERARFMLGDMAERQSTADAARTGDARPGAGGPPGSSPSGTAAGASRGPRFQPDLRRVGPGETRVLGIFRSVDCRKDAVVLNIDQEGRVHRLSAAKLDNVEFISYRQNAPTGVSCGPQPQALPVLATFRAPDDSAGVDGYVVAIEMVEDGYVPR